MKKFNEAKHTCRGRLDDIGYAILHREAAAGKPVAAIARRLRVSRDTCTRWLDRNHPPSRATRAPPRNAGKVTSAVSERRALVHRLALAVESVTRQRFTPVKGMARSRTVTRKKYPSSSAIARELVRRKQPSVTPLTVRRDLAAVGLKPFKKGKAPTHTAEHKAERVRLCTVFGEDDLLVEGTMWSDESTFDGNGSYNEVEWAASRDDVTPQQTEQNAESVMVLGFIGVGYRHLVRVPTVMRTNSSGNRLPVASVTRELYEEMLTPIAADLRRFRYFMQDNAPAHTALFNSGWFEKRRVSVLEWPARSPDLNPIETMWALVGRAVSRAAPYGRDEVWEFVKEAWDAVPQESVDALCREFELRRRACLVNDGGLVRRPDVLRQKK